MASTSTQAPVSKVLLDMSSELYATIRTKYKSKGVIAQEIDCCVPSQKDYQAAAHYHPK